MRRSHKISAWVLCAVLTAGLFSGCSQKSGKSEVKLENGDFEGNSIVIQVGDTGAKYSEVQNYSYLLKKQYEGKFGSELWEYALTDKKSIGDEAKEDLINMITQIKVICASAREQEITLTNDEKDDALRMAEEVVADAAAEDKQEYYLTVQNMANLYEENMLSNKMFYIAADGADTEISDEEARQVWIWYFVILTQGERSDGETVSMTEEEKQEAYKKTKKLRNQAAKSDEFLEFAKNHSDIDETEVVVGKDSVDVNSKVLREAMLLKQGETSQVIETPEGYYVLYCADENDEEATYAKKEAIIEENQTRLFKQKYAIWLGDSKVSIGKAFWREFTLGQKEQEEG